MTSVVAYESQFDLLKFRFFLLYHMRRYLPQYNTVHSAGENMTDLYSVSNCGFKQIYSKYVYARLYFNYTHVGFFTKNIKFDKYLSMPNNACELVRKTSYIKPSEELKYQFLRPGKNAEQKLIDKCKEQIYEIYYQDKQVISDWITEIEAGKVIHTYYRSRGVLEQLKIIYEKLEKAKVGEISILSDFQQCDDMVKLVPLLYYKKTVEYMFDEFNIDENESRIVPDKQSSIITFLKGLAIGKKRDDDLNRLRGATSMLDDDDLDISFLNLLKKINQVTAKSSQIGEKTISLNNKYKFLEKKKKEYIRHKKLLESNINDLVDRLNKARTDVQMMKNIKLQDIDSAQFVASDALNRKLKEIENMEKSAGSLRSFKKENDLNIEKIQNRIKSLDDEIKGVEQSDDFASFLEKMKKIKHIDASAINEKLLGAMDKLPEDFNVQNLPAAKKAELLKETKKMIDIEPKKIPDDKRKEVEESFEKDKKKFEEARKFQTPMERKQDVVDIDKKLRENDDDIWKKFGIAAPGAAPPVIGSSLAPPPPQQAPRDFQEDQTRDKLLTQMDRFAEPDDDDNDNPLTETVPVPERKKMVTFAHDRLGDAEDKDDDDVKKFVKTPMPTDRIFTQEDRGSRREVVRGKKRKEKKNVTDSAAKSFLASNINDLDRLTNYVREHQIPQAIFKQFIDKIKELKRNEKNPGKKSASILLDQDSSLKDVSVKDDGEGFLNFQF